MAIEHQIHDRFKIFVGPSVDDIRTQVRTFTTGGSIAAKSIGVEYLETTGRLLVSLGYAQRQPGYAVTIESKSLGKMDLEGADGQARLAAALEGAAAQAGDVICHELFVTKEGDVNMVFMKKF